MQNYLWHDTKLNDKIRENEQEGNGFKRFEGLYHVCSSGFIHKEKQIVDTAMSSDGAKSNITVDHLSMIFAW